MGSLMGGKSASAQLGAITPDEQRAQAATAARQQEEALQLQRDTLAMQQRQVDAQAAATQEQSARVVAQEKTRERAGSRRQDG